MRSGVLRSPSIATAFRAVPRHLFLPGTSLEAAYRDQAVTTKRTRDGHAISSSTQPSLMAGMLEQLELEPGQRVLEIGAGTGYNAALMAQIVGPAGHVATIDVDDEVVAGARQHLAAAGFDVVEVVCGDGVQGYAPGGPYDRIIVTVGAHDIAPAWRTQLAPGGRLVVPLVLRARQKAIAFEPSEDGLTSVSIRRGIVFMPLRDTPVVVHHIVQLAPNTDVMLEVEDARQLDVPGLRAALDRAGDDWVTDVRVAPDEATSGLATWLELHDPGFCHIFARGPNPDERVPDLTGDGEHRSTFGLYSDASLALLIRLPRSKIQEHRDAGGDGSSFLIGIRAVGSDAWLVRRLLDQIRSWDESGRPTDATLRIQVRPRGSGANELDSPSSVRIEKTWMQYICDWRVRC